MNYTKAIEAITLVPFDLAWMPHNIKALLCMKWPQVPLRTGLDALQNSKIVIRAMVSKLSPSEVISLLLYLHDRFVRENNAKSFQFFFSSFWTQNSEL